MRFEIRSAGMVAILVGLAGLSAVVFALGLVAGYEMRSQSAPQSAQVAGVYPAPSAPAIASSPTASPAAQAMASPAVAPSPGARPSEATRALAAKPRPAAMPSLAEREIAPAAPAPPVRPAARRTPSPATVSTPRVARERAAPPPTSAAAALPTEATPESASRGAEASSAPTHHKPYNIQIDAVMDRQNADRMTARLRKLGYHAFLVPTTIDGNTWWRVRVGPYGTKEEARAAQERLREQYREAYAADHP